MNPQTMTCDECRDELARRAGWKHITEPTDEWDADTRSMTMYPEHWIRESTHDVAYCHPYPPTLDGAAGALPEGWWWSKFETGSAGVKWVSGPENGFASVTVYDTGDEITDRYRLALCCVIAGEKTT